MVEVKCSKCEKIFQIKNDRIAEVLKSAGVKEDEIDRLDLLDILNVNLGKCKDKIRHNLIYPQSFTTKADNLFEKHNEQINRKNIQIKRKSEVENDIEESRKVLEAKESIEKEINDEITKIESEMDTINNQCIEETGLSATFWKKQEEKAEKQKIPDDIKKKLESRKKILEPEVELEKQPKPEQIKSNSGNEVDSEIVKKLKEYYPEFLKDAKADRLSKIYGAADDEHKKGNIKAAFRNYVIFYCREYENEPDKVDNAIDSLNLFNRVKIPIDQPEEPKKDDKQDNQATTDDIRTVTLVCGKCGNEEEFSGTKEEIIKKLKKSHKDCGGDIEIKDISKYILTIKIVDGNLEYIKKGMEILKNKRIDEERHDFDYDFNDIKNEVIIELDSFNGRDGLHEFAEFLVRKSSKYTGKLQENYQVDWL